MKKKKQGKAGRKNFSPRLGILGNKRFLKLKNAKEKEKEPCGSYFFLCYRIQSNSTGHFAGTQATGAGVHTLRGTVYNSLNALDVRLPSPVGATVRVGYSDTERNILAAEFTFCHICTSLKWAILKIATTRIITAPLLKCKFFFKRISRSQGKPCVFPRNSL